MDKIIKNIHVRNFESRDAEVCFKIRRAAFIQKFQPELGARATAAGVDAFMPDDYVQMAQTGPFFVAEDDGGGVIGFVTLERKGSGVAEIPLIYIDLDQIGKQIGQTMMGYIEQWVTTNWSDVTTLIVNTVIPEYNGGFYRKVGFIPAGDAICRFGNMPVRALRLEKKLGS